MKENNHPPCDEHSVCVVDFCGTAKFMGYSEPVSMAADYYPAENKTVFTGSAWHDVPDLISATEPTEEACEAWAKTHSSWEKQASARRASDAAFRKRLES